MSDEQRQPQAERGLAHWLGQFFDRIGLRQGGTVREELTEALSHESTGLADISPQERSMLSNVLGLRERRVGDVMVPRSEIVAVAEEASLGELLVLFKTAGHSRLPVYADSLDDPRGMVHIRDFLQLIAERSQVVAADAEGDGAVHDLGSVDLGMPLSDAGIVRPVLYVPPSMPAVDLLVRMQTTRTHIALVIDEYGGTDGLVSIENLIEIVVGDIEDEHDLEEAPTIRAEAGGRYLVDARARLDALVGTTGIDLSRTEIAEDIDTLGGLVVTLAGRVPLPGETVAGPDGLLFEVVEADQRRLREVRIVVPEPAPVEEPGHAEAP